jgi:hypothetical protein
MYAKMATWEYKIKRTTKSMWSGKDKTNVDQLLNNLGREGWELTSVVPDTTTGTLLGYHFFFKRSRF